MTERLRIIVTGLMAQYPLGGVTWDYVQYPIGLAKLGHDVYYFEDTGQWPYDPRAGGLAKEPDFNVAYLAGVMAGFGLEDRWAYRFPWQSQWFGLSEARRREVVRSADLLINVSGTLERPAEYRSVRRLAYIDSDPMFTQIKLAQGQPHLRTMVDLHDVHFSFGETLSDRVPATGHRWLPTRQPVVLDQWQRCATTRRAFTTIMNWTSYKDLVFAGETYGQKDREFLRFIDLPELVAPTVLEVAANIGKTRRTPRAHLSRKGWSVVDPMVFCPDAQSYRRYVQTSLAEWSVAKHAYVAGRTGWFSCRSACYLAAGRPVVVQDTGFGEVLPTGRGLLTFDAIDEAAAAIRDVEHDYDRHAAAAREIAEAFFDSDEVLTDLIDKAFALHD
jgi:hypothetical protein